KKATCFEMFSELFESWYEVNAYPSSGGISIFFKDISERKRTLIALEDSQRKLAEAADQLNSILESIGDGFFAMDNNFIVTYWNKKAEEILGKKREEIIGKNVWDEYKEAVSLQFYAKTIEAMSHQTPVHFEEHLPSVNAWLEVSAYPSKSGLSVYFRNVTDRVQQEKKLSLSNERYELVTKATTDAIWDWDIAANTIYFNEAFTTQFGYAHSVNSLAESWSNNIYAEDTETVLESLSNALADAATKTWECEYRFTRANGDVAYVYDRGFILRNNAGEAIRMVGSMQDTTRQREAEMELRRLSLVAKQTVNAVVITDINEKITWVNQAFTDITEYSFEEAVGKTPKELLQGEETSEATRAYLQQCIQEKKPFSCEIINYSKSGRKYWIEINGQPIFNHKGEVEQLFAIQTDVTERKKNEQAIRLSEQRYKLLFYQSPRPKWIFNIDTLRIVEVNEAALQLYGYSRKEFLQLTITDLKVNEDVKEFNQLLKTLKKDKDFAYQNVVRHLKKSGQLFYIDITTHSIELPSGMHVIVVGNDVTEKFELEKMLIEEKISAQKEIAKAIINTQEKERSEIGKELHDNVNQILTTAKLYVENIQYYPDQTDQFTFKGRDLIQKSINEIRYLSKQLVTPVLNDLGFKATIDELITHYQSLNLFKINFTYTIKDEKIDKGLQLTIYRIVQEQLNNIVKYAKAENVTVIVSQQKTSFKVFISDDGIGFDTSKEPRGLGLSNIKNRAEVYKGKVVIISSPGAGCSLKIIFPL
ncbi:MAG TPA: PAS domain S-box protein, partial [Chitinophagaceae bacterium]|nr:PAS domain S-box protein [Chitinophagaceae bacterium]